MKTPLLAALAAAASLLSSAAFAYDYHPATAPLPPPPPGVSNYQRPAPHANGRYELQNTQQWVPGRYVHVRTRHGVRTQWEPGHYQTVQQYVWVEYRPGGPRFGRHHGWAHNR